MVMYKIESAEMISLLVTRNYLSIDVGHGGAQTNRDGENNPKQKADPLMILKHLRDPDIRQLWEKVL